MKDYEVEFMRLTEHTARVRVTAQDEDEAQTLARKVLNDNEPTADINKWKKAHVRIDVTGWRLARKK